MKLLVILTIFEIVFTVTNGKKSADPNCNQDIFDNCCNRMLMLGDKTFVFPTSMAQMNNRCKELKPLQQCMKDYTARCLKGDAKSAVSVVVYSFGKTNRGYCSSTARKNSFISFGSCTNSHRKKLSKFMHELNQDIHGVRLYKDAKLKIPLLCCNYLKFKAKIINALTGKCKESEVQEVENLVDGYARDGLNFVCGDYTEESDKCSQIIDKTPKWTKALTSKSFVIPAVDILGGL